MYITDYHTHSHNSFDGYISVDTMVKRAIKENVMEMCVTDHYECSDSGVLMEQGFIKTGIEIEEAKKLYSDRIKLRFGIELGQMHFEPDLCRDIIAANDFDFIIGSVHNLKNDLDIYYVKFDDENKTRYFEEYLEHLYKLAKTADYDVLGHITYPLRYMARDGVSVDIKNYAAEFDDILKAAISRGRGIEVNSSGFSNALNDTMPPLALIKRYHELGGEIITTGSDAHKEDRIGQDIDRAQKLIRAAGFTHIATFEKRKPSFYKIED